jgi:hypothetical protein
VSYETEVIEEISFEESPRTYRIEIPNIVDELHEAGLISNNALLLYTKYRRIAGPGGTSWVGLRGLAKKCNISKDSVARAKLELLEKRPELNGKSLILNFPGDKKKEQADRVKITDIWWENHNYFKNKLTCLTTGTPMSHGKDTHVSPEGQKNEHLKKEPIFKKTNEEKPRIVHKSKGQSFVSATPTPAEGPFPFSKKKKKQQEPNKIDFEDPDIVEILSQENEYIKAGISANEMCKWIQKYETNYILETLKLLFKTLKTSKKYIEHPVRWMQKALDDNYLELEERKSSNKEFAEKFKQEHNLTCLDIKARYCTNKLTGKDAYYDLPRHTFCTILQEMRQRDI